MIIHTTPVNPLKILVLGYNGSGKSAVTVRYLTKRYIGEYSSCRDFLYHHSFTTEAGEEIPVDIMDASGNKSGQLLYDQISWADAFVVVYSIDEKKSLIHARYLLEAISLLKGPKRSPVLLLGNKRDLEHTRQVQVEDGQETSLRWSCQFYEVSAAESSVGVTLAFQVLIREAQVMMTSKFSTPVMRRKTYPLTVGKMFGLVLGIKHSDSSELKGKRKKKRPSLSI